MEPGAACVAGSREALHASRRRSASSTTAGRSRMFFGALSDIELDVAVSDTWTGEQKLYLAR